MSEYKYRPQPLDLAYAPPRLPGHDYTGPGWIATIRIGTGPGDVVGHLTATESFDAIGFDSLAMFTHEGTAPADTDAGFVRKAVQAVLRRAGR
jgi:hypothetical protein